MAISTNTIELIIGLTILIMIVVIMVRVSLGKSWHNKIGKWK